MRVRNFLKKYYATALLIIFVLTLAWGIGRIWVNTQAIAELSNPNVLKLVHFTDVHIDSFSKSKAGRMYASSRKLFKEAISQVKGIDDVDMVVFSGDNINRPVGKDLEEFIRTANTLVYPWYAAIGNHDISVSGRLTKEKYMGILCNKNPHFHSLSPYFSIMPKRKFRVIFLDGVIDDKITSRGHFDAKQLHWLDRRLSDYRGKKVVIVQHFPVVEPYSSDNHRVDNAKEYLRILDKHKNVVAVLTGHYHCAKIIKRKNVLHITTPALVQYPNAFRVLTIEDKGELIKVGSQLYETGLSKIRAKSKKGVKFAAPLLNGLPSDRDTVFYLSK